MRTISKRNILTETHQEIEVPGAKRVMAIGPDEKNVLSVWVERDPEDPVTETVEIHCLMTDENYPEGFKPTAKTYSSTIIWQLSPMKATTVHAFGDIKKAKNGA